MTPSRGAIAADGVGFVTTGARAPGGVGAGAAFSFGCDGAGIARSGTTVSAFDGFFPVACVTGPAASTFTEPGGAGGGVPFVAIVGAVPTGGICRSGTP